MIKLERLFQTPILEKQPSHDWEASSCFNAGIIKDKDLIHMFYRATDKSCNGSVCSDYMNYIGHAVSRDGIHFKRDDDYILGPDEDKQWARGCEDPRVMKVEDRFYMLYTGYGARYPGDFKICMSTSDDLVEWEHKGILLDESNKDAALFSEKIDDMYVLLHRRPPAIWMAKSKDLKHFEDHQVLAQPIAEHDWEDAKIGIAGPPIKTDLGYILIYHGVSNKKTSFGDKGDYAMYSLGIMLLDKDDLSKVVYRQAEPILKPELDWELDGNVPNVVFSCGQVIIGDDLYVYYAGADEAMGVAKCPMKEILALFKEISYESTSVVE